MLAALKSAGHDKGTLVIIAAKHGQSPINHALRQAVSAQPILSLLGLRSSRPMMWHRSG